MKYSKRKMKKPVIFSAIMLLFSLMVVGQDISEKEGVYYQNGKPYSGVLNEYYPNGKVKTELNLKNGLKVGRVKIFSEKGQLAEIRSFKKNEMHGTWVVYNEKGMKTSIANYKNGLKHGKWIIWNDNGILIYELYYTKGEKSGTWKSYDESGSLLSERKY